MQTQAYQPSTPVERNTAKVTLVRREEIQTVHSVEVNQKVQNLGILKDFRRHPQIAAFLPDQARLSMAWVRLEPGEELAIHEHPTESMIVMASGLGQVQGDYEGLMASGDIILIPRGCRHGFFGAGESGFWALSIQFEGNGLYEKLDQARVQFEASEYSAGLKRLLALNAEFAKTHRDNRLFSLVSSGALSNAPVYERFFAAVLIWSGYFQRAILARSATTDAPRFSELFRQHLEEEFGHDRRLARDLGAVHAFTFDPILEAGGNWFCWKMVTGDATEKLVLVHLVLEVGSDLFSAHAAQAGIGMRRTDYFTLHDAVDDEHVHMGTALLDKLDPITYQRLMKVQSDGWSMLELISTRIAELALGEVKG